MEDKLKSRYVAATLAEFAAEYVHYDAALRLHNVRHAPHPVDTRELAGAIKAEADARDAYAKARARSRSAYEVLREAWLVDRVAE